MDKNKLNYITIILAICVVLAGLGGYYLGLHYADNGSVEETEKEENKPTEEKPVETDEDIYNTGKVVDEKLTKELFEKTNYDESEEYFLYNNITFDELGDREKIIYAIDNNKEKIDHGRKNLYNEDGTINNEPVYEMTLESLKKSFYDTFGSDKKFPDLDKIADDEGIVYNYTWCGVDGDKVLCVEGMGDAYNGFTVIDYDKAVSFENDDIYLYAYKWNGVTSGGPNGDDIIFDKETEKEVVLDEEESLKDYKDLASRWRLTFRKDTNGNYYWEKTEEVK